MLPALLAKYHPTASQPPLTVPPVLPLRAAAEYAFQQRKKIIPILMEAGYKPSGWLGALIGTRLYFSLHDARQIPTKMPGLIKELGDAGR